MGHDGDVLKMIYLNSLSNTKEWNERKKNSLNRESWIVNFNFHERIWEYAKPTSYLRVETAH